MGAACTVNAVRAKAARAIGFIIDNMGYIRKKMKGVERELLRLDSGLLWSASYAYIWRHRRNNCAASNPVHET
jgi:hypothetical protein